ncbi:MAG: oligopeptide transporter, OPT family [Deltaproteobacteria bacterium]|nr:oligopeptide transporter, OPT family [Deltaproteobacteria bacterium]|tara:strand:- start:44 stop:1927 length:1884 start_codon:yes stop_codon:yes gene_type:complete
MPSPKGPVAELSFRVVVLGIILSVVMGAANVYLGLKAGMTVSASIPAAVLAMLIFRGIMRDGTILEANQVQTTASAGESLAAGIIFTVPALVLLGTWQKFDMVMTTLIAFTGGLLGILMMIPMRRVFVTGDNDELTFPEGVACASVLEASSDESGDHRDALGVVYGAIVGGLFKFLASFLGLFHATLEGAMTWGRRIFYFGSDSAPLLVGVGFIVRLNVAFLLFLGGTIGWLIAIPLLGGTEAMLADPLGGAWSLWKAKIRFIGVGAMVIGGIASIVKVRHGLVQAVRELRKSSSGQEDVPETDRDLPSRVIVGLAILCITLIGIVYAILTKHIAVAIAATVIMVVMSFFFTAVASYIVGLVGNSNSPVSGMTITAVLFTGGMLMVFGFSGEAGMLSTLGVAAIVCCTACTSGDVCNDLKTGQIVGASPYKQQTMQIVGVAVAAVVMAPVMQLLHNNTPGGIGGKLLAAPQAGLFASLAKGLFGDGKLPWDMVGIGAGVGVVILIVDAILERRKSSFRAHIMPIAVGIYLPFGLAIPILIGGLLAHFLAGGAKEKEAEQRLHRGVLFSSGVIAGESLMGVGLALLASMGLKQLKLGIPGGVLSWLTFVGMLSMVGVFYFLSKPRQQN